MPKIGKPSATTNVSGTDSSKRTTPEPGNKYITHGGETLMSILAQAYGDQRYDMLAALMGTSVSNPTTGATRLLTDVDSDKPFGEGMEFHLPELLALESLANEGALDGVDPDEAKRSEMANRLAGSGSLREPLGRTMAGLSKPVLDSAAAAHAASASESVDNIPNGKAVGIQEKISTTTGVESKTSIDGSSLSTTRNVSATIDDDASTLSEKTTTTNVDERGNTSAHARSTKVMVGDDTSTMAHTNRRTETDAEGNSTTRGASVSAGDDYLNLSGERSTTAVGDDGARNRSGVSGGIKLDGGARSVRMDGAYETTETDADGRTSSASSSANVSLNEDGEPGRVGVARSTSESTDTGTRSRNSRIDVDLQNDTLRMADAAKETNKNEDGTAVGHAAKSSFELDVNDPAIKAAASRESTVTDADGSSTASRMGVSGSVSGDEVRMGLSGGQTTTDADGNSLSHDEKVNLRMTDDTASLSGTSTVESSENDAFGGRDKLGASNTLGVNIGNGNTTINASSEISSENKWVDGDTTTTVNTEHELSVDTTDSDVSFRTGGSRTRSDKTHTHTAKGNVGASIRDGLTANSSYAVSDRESGASAEASAGVTLGRDGDPAFLGDISLSRTGEEVKIKTEHGFGGRISSRKLDGGYRYTVTNPDGRRTGGHAGVAIVGDKVRGVVGGSEMATTKVGDRTMVAGMSGNLSVGAESISVSARHNRMLIEKGHLLPSEFARSGGFLSFRGNQLTQIGDKVTEENDPNFGKYKVSTTRKLGGTLGADVSGAVKTLGKIPIGIGGSLGVSRDKQVFYSTHLSEDRARKLGEAEERRGLKRRIVGAALIDAPVDIPDLSQPDKLRVGDQVKLNTQGTLEVGAFVSAAIVFQAGVKASVTGEFEITVDKTGDHTVEVEVVPRRVTGGKIFADGIVADAYISYAVAQQIGQKFRFDLNTESGLRAYQQALNGTLPGALSTENLDARKHNLTRMQREFAPGVERIEVSRTTSYQKAVAAKAGFLFLKSGVEHSQSRTDKMVSDGETSARATTYERTKSRRTILSGTENNGVSGSARSTTVQSGPHKYQTKFDGYIARAFFSDTRLRGDEYKREMVQVLNDTLDAGLVEPSVEGPSGLWDTLFNTRSRRIEATVDFNRKNIISIVKSSSDAITTIAGRHGMDESAIHELIRKMRDSPNAFAGSRRLDRFLQEQGRSGLGALIKLANISPDDVEYATKSGSYRGVIDDSKKYLLKNGKRMTAGMGKSELSLRFKKGEKLLQEVKHGLELLGDDPVYKLSDHQKEKASLKAELLGIGEALENAMNTQHLPSEDALDLWTTLDRGWTTGSQARAQQRIIKAGGLTVHENDWTRMSAHGVREEGGLRKDVKLSASHKLFPLFGDERTQVAAASVREVSTDGLSDFKSFTFEARIVDEALRWNDMNDLFVDRINQAYGTDFRKSQVVAKGEQQLILRQTLLEGDLDAMSSLDPQAVFGAIVSAGGTEKDAAKAALGIAEAKDRKSLVGVLEVFIQDHGIMATGALHRISRLMDSNPDFQLESLAGSIQSSFVSVQEIVEKYERPIKTSDKTKDIASRYKSVRRAQSNLIKLHGRVLDYPFYTEAQRQELSSSIEAVTLSLNKCLDMSQLDHDAAVRVYVELDRGWTRGSSYQAMSRIQDDAGLRFAESSWLEGFRSGESMRRNDDGSSIFHSTTTRKHGGFLLWGGYQEQVSCKCISSQHASSQVVRDLEVRVELSEKNASKEDFSNHFIQRIEKTLHLELGNIDDFPETGHDRTVVVTMQLTQDDIRKTREISPAVLQEAPPMVADLINDLESLPPGESQAQRIGAFLKDYGLDGLGALKSLFRKPNEAIVVESTNGLLPKLQESVDISLTLYEGTHLMADMTKKELTMRYQDLSRAEQDVETMIQAVRADPFVRQDDSTTKLQDLNQMLNTLRQAFRPEDLSAQERDELISELDAGWTTDLQYEIIDKLTNAIII